MLVLFFKFFINLFKGWIVGENFLCFLIWLLCFFKKGVFVGEVLGLDFGGGVIVFFGIGIDFW